MQEQGGNQKISPYKRYVIAGVLLLFIVGVSTMWVFNTDKSFLATTFSIILLSLSVIFGLFQWILPQSAENNATFTSDTAQGGSVKRSQKTPKEFRVPVLVDIDGVDLEVTNKRGALVVYTNDSLWGKSLELFHALTYGNRHSSWGSANVNKRTKNGEDIFVAAFPRLPEGSSLGISVGRPTLINLFANACERCSLSVKYEEVYLHDYTSPKEARQQLSQYFHFYNQRPPHQALNYQVPAEVYFQGKPLF